MTEQIGRRILYLSEAEIATLALAPLAILEAVENAIRTHSAEQALSSHGFDVQGRRFLAKAAASRGSAHVVLKWLGVGGAPPFPGVPGFHPLIILSDLQTAYPVCLMAGGWVTGLRTAALTGLCARMLARPDAVRIGFVGCGVQARSHLAMLRALFPIRSIAASARGRAGVEAFCAAARAQGLDARAKADPRDVIRGSDIVVTTVPIHGAAPGFLDAGLLAPGSFVAMVDRGFSWMPQTLRSIDRIVTDDLALSGPGGSEGLVVRDGLAGDLIGLLAGTIPPRVSPHERTAFAFSGTALADLAAAALVYRVALERGIGTWLPL